MTMLESKALLDLLPLEWAPPSQPDHLPGWLERPHAVRQEEQREYLSSWLQEYRMQDLRKIAARRRWPIKGAQKESLGDQIAERMDTPAAGLEGLKILDREQRLVLAALVLGGLERYTSPAPARPERIATALGWQARGKLFGQHTECLCELGLAVRGESVEAYPAYYDWIPDILARWLLPAVQEVWAKREAASERALGPGGELTLADPYAFVQQVDGFLAHIERSPQALQPPRPKLRIEKDLPALQGWNYDPHEVQQAWQKNPPHPRSNLTLAVPEPLPWLPAGAAARLAGAGPAPADFVYALLAAGGLCLPGSPATVWPEVRTHWLRLGEAGQQAVLARTYFATEHWSELWGILNEGEPRLELRRHLADTYYQPEHLRNDLVGLRRRVLRALACLPDGQWIDLGALYPLMQALWPQFAFSVSLLHTFYSEARPSWFLADARSHQPIEKDDPRLWERAQGEFIRRLIAGPLHWLGLADLRRERGALQAFRLRGLADLFFDRVVACELPPRMAPGQAAQAPLAGDDGRSLSVQPAAIGTQAHELLEKIALLRSATSERFVYELDAGVVFRSFEKGVSPAQILDEWPRLLPMPMPEAMRAQLAAWWAGYGRVRIYEGLTVIEFADDYALAELKAVTSLGRQIVAEVSPRLVIIPEAAAAGLAAEMEKAGHTPKREGGRV